MDLSALSTSKPFLFLSWLSQLFLYSERKLIQISLRQMTNANISMGTWFISSSHNAATFGVPVVVHVTYHSLPKPRTVSSGSRTLFILPRFYFPIAFLLPGSSSHVLLNAYWKWPHSLWCVSSKTFNKRWLIKKKSQQNKSKWLSYLIHSLQHFQLFNDYYHKTPNPKILNSLSHKSLRQIILRKA